MAWTVPLRLWVKRLYAGVPALCCAALGFMVLCGQGSATKRITCTEVAIADQENGQFAFIDARGFHFIDKKGKAELGRTPDGMPFLKLSGPKGPQLEIGMDHAGVWRLAMCDKDGRETISVGTAVDGRAGIVISDGVPRVEIMVGARAGPAWLKMNDQDGRERVAIGIDSRPVARFMSERGEVIWRQP